MSIMWGQTLIKYILVSICKFLLKPDCTSPHVYLEILMKFHSLGIIIINTSGKPY